MKQYEVSYGKGDVYHAVIVYTEKSPVDVGLWFKENKPDYFVTGIAIATSDSMKPGKPILRI